MRIEFDSLRYAKLLESRGLSSKMAESIISTLTEIEILNIYSLREVNGMLSESVKEVFRTQEEKLAEQRREFDARMQSLEKYHEAQLSDNRRELLASRRWLIGTMVTIGFSLAAYLSAMLHLSH